MTRPLSTRLQLAANFSSVLHFYPNINGTDSNGENAENPSSPTPLWIACSLPLLAPWPLLMVLTTLPPSPLSVALLHQLKDLLLSHLLALVKLASHATSIRKVLWRFGFWQLWGLLSLPHLLRPPTHISERSDLHLPGAIREWWSLPGVLHLVSPWSISEPLTLTLLPFFPCVFHSCHLLGDPFDPRRSFQEIQCFC